jgi:glycosyltransferase involved in cell wall biosynthesis
MKKPNLGIIANAVSDEGKNIYLTKFLNILKPLSNEIFVIDGDFPEIPDRRIHIIKIKADLKKESMLTRSIKFILIQLKCSNILIKVSKNIDIVIFFGATTILPMLLAKFLKKKIIVILGGSAWKTTDQVYRERLFGIGGLVFPFILRSLERIGLTISDRIVVYSESVIKFLGLERYKDKILIISNIYLDANKYKITKNLKERRNLIGFISRLNEGKGIMNFVNAIPLILKERTDLEFLIGGDGALFDEIEQKLKNNGTYNKVKLTGWIPHDELPDKLNELKLLVFPSYSEGLPNIVSESMTCGTPVLATPVGGVPDLIRDRKTGFIMEDNSPEGITKNVIMALNHPNLDNIVKNARRLIEERYTYEAAVEKYGEMLNNLGGGENA